MQLQASHPKSSCNKGLDKRLYKGNLFLDVYSQFLFTKEVVLSVLYFTSLRTTHAWDVLPNSKYLCRTLTKQPCQDKSNQREHGTPG